MVRAEHKGTMIKVEFKCSDCNQYLYRTRFNNLWCRNCRERKEITPAPQPVQEKV